MNNDRDARLRAGLQSLFAGGNGFAAFDRILADVPEDVRGVRPDGFDHSLWELLEHVRIDQREMLDFCIGPTFAAPESYWPATTQPPTPIAWDESVTQFLADLDEVRRIIADPSIDMLALAKHATRESQTVMRVLLVIFEHNAYHFGQFVMMRKSLGAW